MQFGNHGYLRQWNEVNVGGDYEIGRSVRRCVCVCMCLSVCVHELAEICTFLVILLVNLLIAFAVTVKVH